MPSVIVLSVITLSVIMLSVIKVNVFIPNVVTPSISSFNLKNSFPFKAFSHSLTKLEVNFAVMLSFCHQQADNPVQFVGKFNTLQGRNVVSLL